MSQDEANANQYEPPSIGTVNVLRSKYAEDTRTDLTKKLTSLLKEKGVIPEDFIAPDQKPTIIRLSEYSKRVPVIRHLKHWVDGGEQIAFVHPDTYTPFFLNPYGSDICRFCDGKNDIAAIINRLKTKWTCVPDGTLVKDLLAFLLLLEELDLIEFVG